MAVCYARKSLSKSKGIDGEIEEKRRILIYTFIIINNIFIYTKNKCLYVYIYILLLFLLLILYQKYRYKFTHKISFYI